MYVAVSGPVPGRVFFMWGVFAGSKLTVGHFKRNLTTSWHDACSFPFGKTGISFLSVHVGEAIKEDLIAKPICCFVCEILWLLVSTHLVPSLWGFLWAHPHYSTPCSCLNRDGCQKLCLFKGYMCCLFVSHTERKHSSVPSQMFLYAAWQCNTS